MRRLAALALLALVGCKDPATAATVASDVLSASQMLCVLAAGVTDVPAVLTICKLDQALAPDVQKLIQDAQAAGVGRIVPPADAGPGK